MASDSTASEEYGRKYGQIVARAWADDGFKARFLDDPAGVLREFDLPVPDGVELRAVESTDTVLYFTLPARPSADVLSEEELSAVAGGSTVGSAGSGGTISSASCPVGTVGSIGTAGTAACI